MTEQTFNTPPLVTTVQTPEDIIGPGNMDVFFRHYEICSRQTNDGLFPSKVLNKEVGSNDREYIARAYAELRAHGYVANGISNGRIRWSRVLKSESQRLFESEMHKYKGKTLEELKAILYPTNEKVVARVARVKKVDPAESHEIGLQEVIT